MPAQSQFLHIQIVSTLILPNLQQKRIEVAEHNHIATPRVAQRTTYAVHVVMSTDVKVTNVAKSD